MSKKISIPEAALNQHIAILGKTGSGKTWAAKTIVEHLLDQKRQVCVLDPTGAWWGLRLAADGKGRGYDMVLLGGKHADIPLSDKSGAAVARLVTQQGANVIIDTTGFTVGEYTRWFIDFAGTLYTTIQHPLHLVIDEAHYFMPQGKAPDIDAGKMIHAGNRLMSGGRSLGIRGFLITQRPAKLHKDSLTCADTLIAMRVIAPQDRQAIKDWIDGAGDPVQGKAVLDSLAQLKRGEGWAWYPEGAYLERVSFPAIKTYDSSATPTHGAKEGPKVGEINLEEVKAAMAAAVKEAEANDPKLLRAEVAKLKAELSKAASAKPAATKVEMKQVEVNVVKPQERLKVESAAIRLDRWLEKIDAARAGLAEERKYVADALGELKKSLDAARREGEPAAITRQPTQPPRLPPRIERPRPMPPTTAQAEPSANGISARQQKFLNAAATLKSLNTEVTRATVAAWIGVHPRGGSVGEELKALEGAGYIVVDRGRVV